MSGPVTNVLSDKVTMRWGYPDGHVEIDVKLGSWVPAVTHTLDVDDVGVAHEAFRLANAWADGVKNRKRGPNVGPG